MNKAFIAALLFSFLLCFLACRHEVTQDLDIRLQYLLNNTSPEGAYESFILPSGDDYTQIPNQDAKNPITEAKVELGKMLFFETGLGLEPKYPVSKEGYSCASCHIPGRGFTAGRFQGIGDGAIGFGVAGEGRRKNPLYDGDEVDAQGARPLPVINTAFITNALWAGSFGSYGVNTGTESVWNQDTLIEINFKGLQGLEANNARALVVHRQVINKNVTDSLGYTVMFDEAFPEFPESERYTRLTGSFAIAAYLRTILTTEAPFQKWLKGDLTAMSDQQKEGALLFFGKAGCVRCHNSPSLNSFPHQFFSLGVKNLHNTGHGFFATGQQDKRNKGRGGFTGEKEDMNKFKVPQLYNLKHVDFFFHGASKNSLREVVVYFNEAVPENHEIPLTSITPYFQPLNLTEAEIDDLVEFLENGLYDPHLERYAPSAILSGNCFPDNDLQAQIDLGCL